MGKFLYNVGYHLHNVVSDGVIFLASGRHSEAQRRRVTDFAVPDGAWVLFDPQLYLVGLDGKSCAKTCAHLVTYPWFGVDVPEYSDAYVSETEWFKDVQASLRWVPTIATHPVDIRATVEECLRFQDEVGVTHLIVPTPLIETEGDQFSCQLKWIEAGLDLGHKFQQPLFGTLAIMDHLLSHISPLKNPLLTNILDNLTTSRLDGLYILVCHEDSAADRILNVNVAESLLFISETTHSHGQQSIVNFADDLGYACLAAGSSAFASGYYRKQRRMSFSDFIDTGGGYRLPYFYSHRLISDFLPDAELSKIANARLVRYFHSDRTPESQPLLEAHTARLRATSVPDWQERRNNDATAIQHRARLLSTKTNELAAIAADERMENILTWLQDAEAFRTLVNRKLDAEPARDDGRHITIWRKAVERRLDQASGPIVLW